MFGMPGPLLRVARKEWPELSPEALWRLRIIDWHFANGAKVSKTSRHFTIARQTLYRWLGRYNPKDLRSLEDRSSRPKHCKQATWTKEEIHAVRTMRKRYPRWGKLKLVVLLARQGDVAQRIPGGTHPHLPQTHTAACRTSSSTRCTEHTYNHIRRHQALGFLTPAEFLSQRLPSHHP